MPPFTNIPRVSVIIPTYNRASLVGETIRSVLSQEYSDLELLVLDDHSSDNTKEVVGSFKDPRINYLQHACNIGFAANWTYGVQLAKGKYLAILGDDDLYKQGFLQKRVEAFERHRNVLAVTGPFECRDIDGRPVRRSRQPLKNEAEFSGLNLIKFALGFTGEWFNGATLYRADIVRALWPKAIFAGTAVDISLHIRLCLSGDSRLIFLPDTDMVLRVHADQESCRNSIYLAECTAVLAIGLWRTVLRTRGPAERELFRKRFVEDINHFARMSWDRGDVGTARAYFLNELAINPFRMRTWLRLLRSYIQTPPHTRVSS